jgi:hypothetical protein
VCWGGGGGWQAATLCVYSTAAGPLADFLSVTAKKGSPFLSLAVQSHTVLSSKQKWREKQSSLFTTLQGKQGSDQLIASHKYSQ